MKAGQWTGESFGNPAGRIIVDLDPDTAHSVSGFAYFFNDESIISTAVQLKNIPWDESHAFSADVQHFNHINGQKIPIDIAKSDYGEDFPKKVELEIKRVNENNYELSWGSDVGTFGKSTFVRENLVGKETQVIAEVLDWSGFKERVSNFMPEQLLYRGQGKRYPIQTAFHRTDRKCLQRYLGEDIPALHRATSNATDHVFRGDLADERGALLALAQHHGFPTPLLDWSYSPYVAAWFAFEKAQMVEDDQPDRQSENYVRVFALDREALAKFHNTNLMTFVPPHISLLEVLAIENPRLNPQQGVLTLTNVQNVEQHVLEMEEIAGHRLLHAFEISYSERQAALNELRLMGITRATLFPGLDGICRDLKERRF